MLINSLTAILLLLSLLAPYINPNLFWITSFLGLGFPFLVIINVLFAIYWLAKLKRQFFLPLIVLAIAYPQIKVTFQFNNASEAKNENSIKVMSYNVRLFDLYNWSNNKQTRNKMFRLLQNEDPDIVCFQEFFYSDKQNHFQTKDTLRKILSAKNHHVETVKYVKADKQHFAIATYSKYKILKKGKIDFNDNTTNACIYTDLLVNKDTIRVYNAHLASVKFGRSDYNFIDSVSVNNGEKQLQGVKNIVKRLKKAYQLRAPQALAIAESIEQCPYPIIFCTDMNDTPVSFSYHQINKRLNDSFTEKGTGFGTSYNGKFPAVRIDYIFHSDDFECIEFNTLPDEYSDHYPITTYLNKK